MTTRSNKQIVERFDSLLNTRDLRELDELCTPDMVNHALRPDRPKGLEGTRQWLETEGVNFQTFAWQQLTVVAEDDLVVQFGVRGGDWPGAPFRGFDVPAGPYSRDTAFMYRVTDGRISERWAVNDHLTWLLQLGAIRPGARADA
jgi:ketosteroid isomerase-like protein